MLTKEEKKQILESERKGWEADKYRLELRARVLKNTGQDGQLEEVTKQLESIEAALDEFEKEADRIQ